MTQAQKSLISVDEFLVWAEGRPGRYELHGGQIQAMSPQRSAHAPTKLAVQTALAQGIRKAGLPCIVYPDGMTVRINSHTAYEPDALVYCGPKLPANAIEVPNPVIIVEVLSPSTKAFDVSAKRDGYFSLPGIHDYLIADPGIPPLIHYKRRSGAPIEKLTIDESGLRLDPPGFDLDTAAIFA